ncbi:Fc.00g070130.m01.CDS01 [Cosmosporella sp. VM-42]
MPPAHSSVTSSSSLSGRGRRRNGQAVSRSTSHASVSRATPTRRGSTIRQAFAPPGSQRRISTSSRGTSSIQEGPRSASNVVSSDLFLPGRQLHEASNGGDQSQASDDTLIQEVIMALDMRENATIGCAYFTTLNHTLFLSEDIPMANIEIVEQFLMHAQPTTLLVSARTPERFNKYVEKQAGSPDLDGFHDRFILRRLQSSEFSLDSARERLANLQIDPSTSATAIFSTGIAGQDGEASCQESHVFRSMRCGGSINLNSQVSVSCAGAILGDLHRRRSAGFLPDGQVAEIIFQIDYLRMFSLSAFMFVNSDTLLALQIVQTELHPNSQAWGLDPSKGSAKESLSVYGLFHLLACTPQGRSQLRQLFLRPVLDMELIGERQRTISVLLQPDNADKLRQATSALRKIRNLRTTIAQLRKGIEFPSAGQSFDKGVWATIRHFAAQTLELREVVNSLNGGESLPIVHKLLEGLHVVKLVTVGAMINSTIDFDQSKSRHRSSVRAGVDPQLDELKRRYDGIESFLTEVVNQMNRELPEWACQYIRSCIFLPQLGFLTVVEPNTETENGRYEEEGTSSGAWEKLFTADGAVCYKNKYMRELDEEYGDMYCQIGDREVEIIHDLTSRILEYEPALVQASDLCGEFDAILALAMGAEKYGWKAPCVVNARIIHIEGGRHPLQELVVPAFVSNDCHLTAGRSSDLDISANGQPQALVLTGPNHSGKSVYLKQTAIIVYLAHIGSFVPASQATIGLTDKILTRISTRESMSGAESAFAIDLKQVALSARCCTPRSLVLVDEFGKGTNTDDGAGLLAAMLDHFLSLGQDAPRLLVATHFHEVFEGEYLGHYRELCLAHMDVRVDWETAQVEDQVIYLFKLAYGHSTSSFGGRCAALSGVPSSVVERAEAIALLLARNEDLAAICTRLSQAEELRLEGAETTARRFLVEDFGDATRVEDGRLIKCRLENLLASTT